MTATCGIRVVAKLVHWDIVGDGGRVVNLDEYRKDARNSRRLQGWTDKELELVKKTNVKLRQLLSRSPYKFNFTIWIGGIGEPPIIRSGVYSALPRGVKGTRRYHKGINVLVPGQGTRFYDYKGLSSDVMPATPWILIHWLAEILIRAETTKKLSRVFYEEIVLPVYGKRQNLKSNLFQVISGVLQQVFPFRSAREGMLTDVWEEILVHYINTGGNLKISREPPKDGVEVYNIKNKRRLADAFPKNPEAWPEARKRFKEETEAVLKSVLDDAVGKYIVV